MKNVCLKVGLIALALALVFGVALIVLSVKKEYAENHYEQTVKMEKYAGVLAIENTLGCGKMDCKYCNGQTVGFVHREIEGNTYYYTQFVYYKAVFGLWVACIVLTSISGVTASVAIPLHFKRAKMRRSDREDY